MSNPRLVFALIFIVQCILWSQSRYSAHNFQHRSALQTPGSIPSLLLRRDIVYTDSGVYAASHEKQCRPPGVPVEDQCRHTNKHCTLHPTFLSINYLKHYFCSPANLRPLIFTGLLAWLIFLFSTLGISASDFFTPNLATLAQLLHLDENVAGVTFLAFGNGSPDLFSTFSAMKADSGSLAVGELLGAASFIVSCVVGSMCIIKPFKVDRGPFLRDVGFFTVAIGLLLVILWDGKIQIWEAAILVLMYAIYVSVVVFGSWWDNRRERKRHEEMLIRSEYRDDEVPPLIGNEEPYRDDPSPTSTQSYLSPIPKRTRAISTPPLPRLDMPPPPRPLSRSSYTPTSSPHFTQMPSFSLVGALEFRQVVASLQHQSSATSLNMFESPVTPYAGGHYHSHHLGRPRSVRLEASTEIDPWDMTLSVPLDSRPPLPQHYSSSERVPSIMHTPASPTATSQTETDSQLYNTPRTKRERVLSSVKHAYHTLFPSLHDFRRKSFIGKVAAVFAAPAIMALTLTLPVLVTPYDSRGHRPEKHGSPHGGEPQLIDFEEEGMERALIAEEVIQEEFHDMNFNKWLMAVQCTLGPLFSAGVLFSGTKYLPWALAAAAVGGICAGTLVVLFAVDGLHPMSQMARCSMGFFVAVVWIMAIADEVVNVLQTFGFVFGLSDAIIGLTIFAVGNSLADFVANMSVAVFAPIMGFSACFGGPMLNILLGVGISGTYIIHNLGGQPYDLDFSPTLLVSTIGVLALLVATLVFVPLNEYWLTKRWGVFLIGCYCCIMGVNVWVEVKS